MAVVTPKGVTFTDFAAQLANTGRSACSGTRSWPRRAGYKHFMLKEIFEQPRAVRETLRRPRLCRVAAS